jgi:subtilisin family serine protease
MLEIGMKRFVRTNALASAVGIALASALLSPVDVQAGTFTAAQQAVGAESYIVSFSEDGLLYYQGNVQGFAATGHAPTARAQKLDVHTPAARAYDDYLATQRAAHVAAIESALGRPLAITHSYSITLNGIAADMTADEAARLATVPGVKEVKRAGFEKLATFRGPKFIGADRIWDGTATPDDVGTRGAGIVVGDLDGGTNHDHPSFADDGTCGFDSTHHKLTAVDCSASSGGLCTGSNPEANPGYGHGVHTSSTAAGNTVDNTDSPAPALPDGVSMSGVAPCAAIHQYKVCQTDSCSGAAILAGIQNAIADQVDVVNFSISGGTSPWNDNDRNFLDMVNAGIFVAAAAGNLQTGETDPTSKVNHLGPWMMTVAASTQDEVLAPILSVVGPGSPPDTIGAIPLVPGSTTTGAPTYDDKPIKSYPQNLAACTAGGGIPTGTFTGAIALVRRGASATGDACSFTEKITNAANAGAVMVVVANNQVGALNMDTTGAPAVPAYSIDLTPGDALIAFVGANESDSIVDTVPSGIGNLKGDTLADFSYRGPTLGSVADETKPDITAPGVNIYAALDDSDGNYGLMSGTSMATPHITGSAALIRSVHPDWTPSEVKSALMTTATNANGTAEDGTTPWNPDQVGNGRVDLTQAALAGLTMDETYANYLAANPNGGSIDIKDLNIPSVRDSACDPAGCSWTRTVTNRLDAQGSWTASFETTGDIDATVDPSSFTLAPGASQTITITATPSSSDTTHFGFGSVVLHENNGASPDQRITVAVKPSGDTPPPPTLCNAGECVLKIDNHTDSDPNINALGAGAGTYFVYLNRFTPDATDFPFTLNNVQTVFVGPLSNGDVGAVVGEPFDVYVYVDNDHDPSNGATLVAAVPGVLVADPLGAVQTIELANGGVEIDGPGDVLLALEYHGALGAYPATGDDSGTYQSRSWIGDVHEAGANPAPAGADTIFADGFDGEVVPPTGPDLSAENMVLVNSVVPTFTHNFIVRGNGTKQNGQPVHLGAAKK